ncbi:SNF2 family N-terminal domain-containing protein [Truncatella angustata]|uniref:SNF2 family N-terminal domain-containing protein n=1 Tax=Truncatella angustata TaxID=152316 RepID=A0A9P8UCF1_9PEZI|nr:SNF2 family N-terminal domain-containing protein [Truncatella angustata]KAH6645712.1 SNF2 family N-terminal domain-containing protein [Truncatella angustata]
MGNIRHVPRNNAQESIEMETLSVGPQTPFFDQQNSLLGYWQHQQSIMPKAICSENSSTNQELGSIVTHNVERSECNRNGKRTYDFFSTATDPDPLVPEPQSSRLRSETDGCSATTTRWEQTRAFTPYEISRYGHSDLCATWVQTLTSNNPGDYYSNTYGGGYLAYPNSPELAFSPPRVFGPGFGSTDSVESMASPLGRDQKYRYAMSTTKVDESFVTDCYDDSFTGKIQGNVPQKGTLEADTVPGPGTRNYTVPARVETELSSHSKWNIDSVLLMGSAPNHILSPPVTDHLATDLGTMSDEFLDCAPATIDSPAAKQIIQCARTTVSDIPVQRFQVGMSTDSISEWTGNESPPEMIHALYAHQAIALKWMQGVEEDKSRKGGIMADTMGLGKTITALALILTRPPGRSSTSVSTANQPTLVVAPVALVNQWEREAVSWSSGPGNLLPLWH